MNTRALTLALVIAGFAMMMVWTYIDDAKNAMIKEYGIQSSVVVAKSDIQELDLIDDSKVEIKTDTLRLYYQDSTYLDISSLFLTQYPKTDRLLQMLLDNNNLKLNLQNTKGEVYSKEFKINLNSYSYNYVNNKLTSKKVSFYKKFDFFTELTVRPFNNLWDLDLGLEYKTNKFNYTLGLNGFYYPNQKKNFGSDLFLRVRYKF